MTLFFILCMYNSTAKLIQLHILCFPKISGREVPTRLPFTMSFANFPITSFIHHNLFPKEMAALNKQLPEQPCVGTNLRIKATLKVVGAQKCMSRYRRGFFRRSSQRVDPATATTTTTTSAIFTDVYAHTRRQNRKL